MGYIVMMIFIADAQQRAERLANARQWLRQCAWGIGERFDSLVSESKQLQTVMAAL